MGAVLNPTLRPGTYMQQPAGRRHVAAEQDLSPGTLKTLVKPTRGISLEDGGHVAPLNIERSS